MVVPSPTNTSTTQFLCPGLREHLRNGIKTVGVNGTGSLSSRIFWKEQGSSSRWLCLHENDTPYVGHLALASQPLAITESSSVNLWRTKGFSTWNYERFTQIYVMTVARGMYYLILINFPFSTGYQFLISSQCDWRRQSVEPSFLKFYWDLCCGLTGGLS